MRSPLPRPPTRPSGASVRPRRAEHGHEALAVAGERALEPLRLVGRGHAQRAVVLRQRVLVEHEAGDLAGAGVRRLARLGGVEAVDLRARPRRQRTAVLRRAGGTSGWRRRGRRRPVDRLRAGEDRVAVDVEEALVEVDRQHGQQVQAGERARMADVVARHDRAAERALGDLAAQRRARHVAAHARARDRLRRDEPGRGHDDDPRRAARQPRVDDRAVERHRAAHDHRRRIGDVDLGQDGRRAAVGDVGRDLAGRGQRDGAGGRRHDEQAIAADQQLLGVSVERERPDEPRRGAGHVDRVQRAVGDREHAPAVGLDDVGLVDARLLDVRRRERRRRVRPRPPSPTPAERRRAAAARRRRPRSSDG